VEMNDVVSEPAFIEKFDFGADAIRYRALAVSHHEPALHR
jgi:hypothetical protein